MLALSSQSNNDKLEEFFKDVENLTTHLNDCDGDAEQDAILCHEEENQAKASKWGVMSRAEVNQKAWQDFLGTVPHQTTHLVFNAKNEKGKKPKSKIASDKEQHHMSPLPP